MIPAYDIPPGPRLSTLLAGLTDVSPAQDRAIQGLAMDSRKVRAGDLFLACAGGRAHGLGFAVDAVRAGALAIVYEQDDRETGLIALGLGVPMLAVPGLREKIGIIADRFYGHPSRELFVAGVTGTNGKTSYSQFLAQALERRQHRCGVIGTLGYGLYGSLASGAHTTPDALTLHALLADMRAQGARSVVMEVSSHGLSQGRAAGVAFDVAAWTNLTRDHLDYHGDMKAYFEAKRRLFGMPGVRYAVVNADDPYGQLLCKSLPPAVELIRYGLGTQAVAQRDERGARYVLGTDLRLHSAGFDMRVASSWGEGTLSSSLLGRFNASNLLAVLATLLTMDMPLAEALGLLEQASTVPGRMERFGGGPDRPLVVVDYAHTPDALEQVLLALRAHCTGQLWCVFGCGGERDSGKRPMMGAAAERCADRVVITNDNPRREDPTQIIVEIQTGLQRPDRAYVQHDRAAAIRFAIENARPGDVVLLAGKGHEEYQLIGDEKFPFSDRVLAAQLVGEVPR